MTRQPRGEFISYHRDYLAINTIFSTSGYPGKLTSTRCTLAHLSSSLLLLGLAR